MWKTLNWRKKLKGWNKSWFRQKFEMEVGKKVLSWHKLDRVFGHVLCYLTTTLSFCDSVASLINSGFHAYEKLRAPNILVSCKCNRYMLPNLYQTWNWFFVCFCSGIYESQMSPKLEWCLWALTIPLKWLKLTLFDSVEWFYLVWLKSLWKTEPLFNIQIVIY